MPQVDFGVADVIDDPEIERLLGVEVLVVRRVTDRTRWGNAAVASPGNPLRWGGVLLAAHPDDVARGPASAMVVVASDHPEADTKMLANGTTWVVDARDGALHRGTATNDGDVRMVAVRTVVAPAEPAEAGPAALAAEAPVVGPPPAPARAKPGKK